MSTTLSPHGSDVRRELPANEGTPLRRFLGALATPGGAVYVLALVLLVLIIASNPSFGEPDRLVRSLARSAPIAILAIGQYFVIVSGEFDLSMGSVIAAQVVMAGNLIGDDDSRILPVMLLMIAVGVLVGVLNGVATTLLGVPSFIVTLGMMLALSGFVFYLTGGAATGNPSDNFREIGRGGIEGVPVLDLLPYPLILLIVVGALASWLMRRPYGMTLISAGDNPGAAEVSGATVWWVKTRAFILSSLSATLAGIILVGQAGVHPSVGQGYEFIAITAVVLGGVVLGGGRGWVHLRRGRRHRPRPALHAAQLPRRPLDLEGHRAGRDHHPRRRPGRTRLELGQPPAPHAATPRRRARTRRTPPAPDASAPADRPAPH